MHFKNILISSSLFFPLGVALAQFFPLHLGWKTSWVLVSVALLGSKKKLALCLSVLLLAMFWAVQHHELKDEQRQFARQLAAERSLLWMGRIVHMQRDGLLRIQILQCVDSRERVYQGHGLNVNLRGYEQNLSQVKHGQIVSFEGSLRVPQNPSYAGYLLGQKVIGFVQSKSAVHFHENQSSWDVLSRLRDLRYHWHQKLLPWQRILGQRGEAIVSTLVFGQKSNFDAYSKECFKRSGVYHIFAISGMHVFLWSAALFWILRLCGCSRLISDLCLIGFLVVLCFFVMASSSVLRASLMTALWLISRRFSREASAYRIVLLSASAILCVRPLEIAQAGFQLSFGAVLVILAGKPLWQRIEKLPWPGVLRSVLGAFCLSAVIQLALSPILLWHFSAVSWIAPLSNTLLMPLITALLPFSVALHLLAGFESIAWFFAQICFVLLKLIWVLVEHLAWLESLL